MAPSQKELAIGAVWKRGQMMIISISLLRTDSKSRHYVNISLSWMLIRSYVAQIVHENQYVRSSNLKPRTSGQGSIFSSSVNRAEFFLGNFTVRQPRTCFYFKRPLSCSWESATGSYPKPVESSPHTSYLRSVLILSPRQGLWSCCFPSGFFNNLSFRSYVCPDLDLDLIILVIYLCFIKEFDAVITVI